MQTQQSFESIMGKKLIVPAEIKICATCSYWDGERTVDADLRVVVVDDASQGQCLVKDECRQAMTDEFKFHPDCLWEHLAPDEPEDAKKQD